MERGTLGENTGKCNFSLDTPANGITQFPRKSTVATTNTTGYQVVAQSITPYEHRCTRYY